MKKYIAVIYNKKEDSVVAIKKIYNTHEEAEKALNMAFEEEKTNHYKELNLVEGKLKYRDYVSKYCIFELEEGEEQYDKL